MENYIVKSYLLRAVRRRTAITFTACAILVWFVMVTYAALRIFEIEITQTVLDNIPSRVRRRDVSLGEDDDEKQQRDNNKFDEKRRNLLVHEFLQHVKSHLNDVDNFTDQFQNKTLQHWQQGKFKFEEDIIVNNIEKQVNEMKKRKKIMKDWLDQDIAMKNRIKKLNNIHQPPEGLNLEGGINRILKPKQLLDKKRRSRLKTNHTYNASPQHPLNAIAKEEIKSTRLELETDEKLTYLSKSNTPVPYYDESINKNLQSEIGPISEYTDRVKNSERYKEMVKTLYTLPYFERYSMLQATIRHDLTRTEQETHNEIGPIAEYVDRQKEEDGEVDGNQDWMHVFGALRVTDQSDKDAMDAPVHLDDLKWEDDA